MRARLGLVALVVGVGCSTPSEPATAVEDRATDEGLLVEPPGPPTRGLPVREPIPAWSLTASDGSGLQLVAVTANAVAEGPLAFTELHLRFHNPEARVREGTFAITLPKDATVSRFAIDDGGHYKEAEVVAKALARKAYDDMLHRGIDPAILEKAQGNQFTARVFPIAAGADQELVVSYSQELAGGFYLLPLAGLPEIREVDVVLGATALHERAWTPDRDFIADVGETTAARSGDLVAASFTVDPRDATVADRADALTVLVDTSASRAPGFARYADRVRTLVTALAPARVTVVAFDQETWPIFAGNAADFGDPQLADLVARRADGASDLGAAIAHVTGRVVVIGDGVVTAGLEGGALAALIAAERVDVVLAGGIRDERAAQALARAGKRPGDVFDLDTELAPIARGLGEVVRVDVPIDVPGATWFHPHAISSLRPGTHVTVFARTTAPLAVTIDGVPHGVDAIDATPALVERAAARVEIAELETTLAATTDAGVRKQLETQIETRSVATRVASSQASMLVLDSDADYARYGIDRKALADILVVGPRGLEQTHRTFVASKRPPPPTPTTIGTRTRDAEAGRYGILGAGGGGGGYSSTSYGMAASVHAHVAAVPTVSIGQPMVVGSLDKTMIRRYLRRHLPQIRYCYEHQLLGHPRLHGELMTNFTIAPSGHVTSATATGVDETVAACVAEVIKQVEFPSADDVVVVNYPFVFHAAGSPSASLDPAPVPAVLNVPPAPTTDPSSSPTPPPAIEPPPPPATPTAIQEPAPISVAADPSRPPAPAPVVAPPARAADDPPFGSPASAQSGKLARVTSLLARRDRATALAVARAWRDEHPTDILAIVAVGEALEASDNPTAAARAYGSIIDLYPTHADFRRFAGERLERLGRTLPTARALAIDTYRRAVADRPDQITGHRLLAYALLRNGDYAGAFAAILVGVDHQQHAPADRFAGSALVFSRDAGMIATAYLAHGGDRARVATSLAKYHLAAIAEPSTRFLLYWETDANDVDLHVHDAQGNHAWYQHKDLESGGALYADITTGFGPECFEIRGTPTAGPYEVGVHYYAQGPMGYGMGLLQIVRFDGTGFTFDDRPYVITQDHAYVSLGRAR